MRILLVAFTFPPDANGVANVVNAHADGFLRHGHDVTVVTGWDDRRGEDRKIAGQPQVVQFKVLGNGNLRWSCRGEIEEYRRFLLDWEGDVIFFHVWGTWSVDLAIPLLDRLKPKKIFVSHGFTLHRYPLNCRFPTGFITWVGWKPYVWKLARIMAHFDRIVFLSEKADSGSFFDHLIARRSGLANTIVIPNGVNLNEFDSALPSFRECFALGSGPIALCVANYFRGKNQLLALRAFIRANVPGMRLVFAGGPLGDYGQELKENVRAFGCEDRVMLLENLDRSTVCSAFKESDIFLFSSEAEVAPLVILESMAANLPFISTDVGMVSTLPGGIVIENEEEMSAVLSKLASRRDDRIEFGKAGRSACERTFNWDAIAEAYEQLLKDLFVNLK